MHWSDIVLHGMVEKVSVAEKIRHCLKFHLTGLWFIQKYYLSVQVNIMENSKCLQRSHCSVLIKADTYRDESQSSARLNTP